MTSIDLIYYRAGIYTWIQTTTISSGSHHYRTQPHFSGTHQYLTADTR